MNLLNGRSIAMGLIALLAFAWSVPGACSEEKEQKSKKKGKVEEPLYPVAPTMKDKSGEPIHDYIVDFEKSYAAAQPLLEVDEFTKHEYAACSEAAGKLVAAARKVVQLHEDRLRQ